MKWALKIRGKSIPMCSSFFAAYSLIAGVTSTCLPVTVMSMTVLLSVARARSHAEFRPQINLPAVRIVDEKFAAALAHDLAMVDEVGAIHNAQRLAHVVIRQQDAKPLAFQVGNDLLHLVHRNRVHAAKRLIQQHQLRPR